MKKSFIVLAVAAVIFIIGSGAIVYFGRPVMHLDDATEESFETADAEESEQGAGVEVPAANAGQDETSAAGTYTATQVAQHAVEGDCWSSINGNVYDLTTWVSRHPGGSGPILGLCGKDGTAMFERKHGTSAKPAAMLALLKIGTLAK